MQYIKQLYEVRAAGGVIDREKESELDMPESNGRFGPLVGAIDEGTSSVRFIVFCPRTLEVITLHQIPLKIYCPQEGWVEQNPVEIITLLNECIEEVMKKLIDLQVDPSDIVAVGITNQRESAVAWDKLTGKPLHNAIVWSDMRTQKIVSRLIQKVPTKSNDYWKSVCGLPLAPAFSAFKYKWLLEEVPQVKKAAAENRLCFGTIDSWLIYNLTGGKDGGVHLTDCTNASRTFLMNLQKLKWDEDLCKFLEIESRWLPEIRSSSEIYGRIESGPLKGVPISGCLGDQQAALLAQGCVGKGQFKNTYGTGCFLLCNTGHEVVYSRHGLLATVAFKMGANAPALYAVEGSVAVAGSSLNWLKDNLGILEDAQSAEIIADTVSDTDGIYFVPAFSGLYAPYWKPDARGVIVGITEDTTCNHLIRAALEAVCFQTKDIIEAIKKDCGFTLKELLVDGGMTKNNLLMQLQADLTGIPVVRPSNKEMTALGAAIAAGSAEGVGVWNFQKMTAAPHKVFTPMISAKERESRYSKWKEAVERSFCWVTES